MIVSGRPTDNDFSSVWTNVAEGPFGSEAEARTYLKEELQKKKTVNPELFRKLEEDEKFVRFPAEYQKFRKPIVPEELKK